HAEAHVGARLPLAQLAAVEQQRHGAVDAVRAAAERSQRGARSVGVSRLAVDLAIQADERVAAEHGLARARADGRACLAQRVLAHELLDVAVLELRHARRAHGEAHAEALKDRAPLRRARGEYELQRAGQGAFTAPGRTAR